MIDWFVLLIPLVLLPILLLFGFVGCVLPVSGVEGPADLPILFKYLDGLDTDVQSIAVEFTIPTVAVDENSFSPPTTSGLTLSDNEIKSAGETVPGPALALATHGTVTCRCKVTKKQGEAIDFKQPTDKSKEKIADELPPMIFVLSRDGTGFRLD